MSIVERKKPRDAQRDTGTRLRLEGIVFPQMVKQVPGVLSCKFPYHAHRRIGEDIRHSVSKKWQMPLFRGSKFGQPEVARICKELILQAKSTTREAGKAGLHE